jgi:AAA family ATP:ADP antiporter
MASLPPNHGSMQLTRGERFLTLFTEVRPGEGRTAMLMFVNIFLVLCAYYFVKPLREGWIAVSHIEHLTKMEVKAYSSFGQSLLLVGVVSVYGRMVDRLHRAELIRRATLFCISNLVIFWFLQPDFFFRNLPITGVAFYLWVGMFGVFVVAQFWAFAADLYTDERGRRLIPFVAVGATAGAACGSWLTDLLVDSGLLSVDYLLLAAIVPLVVSISLTRVVDRRGPIGLGPEAAPPAVDTGPRRGALPLVFASGYLLTVALVTLLLNWVNTNGENLLFRVVQEALERDALSAGVLDPSALLVFTREGTTAFYGNFYFWVNVTALLLQAVVASRLLRYGGFGALMLALPTVALVSYAAMAVVPLLAVVKSMKIAENATDYSIANTARSVLWLPVSAEQKYKAKPAIDTLFTRVGDGLAALTVVVGVQFLDASTASFFAFTVALVVAMLLLSLRLVRLHAGLREKEQPG